MEFNLSELAERYDEEPISGVNVSCYEEVINNPIAQSKAIANMLRGSICNCGAAQT